MGGDYLTEEHVLIYDSLGLLWMSFGGVVVRPVASISGIGSFFCFIYVT